ncbi:MAG: NTP transferase domain-containing protein [Bradymonadia bacterium]
MSQPRRGRQLREGVDDLLQRRNPGDTVKGAALILAAGEGRRMGRIKPLITLDGTTLVERAVRVAASAGLEPWVVLGAHREVIAPHVPPEAEVIWSEAWALGMGASIVSGVRHAMTRGGASVDHLMVMLCDQPRVETEDLSALISAAFSTPSADGSAAAYAGVLGPPACFRPSAWPHLIGLPPESGARKLLRGGPLDIVPVQMPHGALDLDTPADLEQMRALEG